MASSPPPTTEEELRCTVALVHHEGKDAHEAPAAPRLLVAWDAAYQIVSHGKRMTLTVVDQKEAEAGHGAPRFIAERSRSASGEPRWSRCRTKAVSWG